MLRVSCDGEYIGFIDIAGLTSVADARKAISEQLSHTKRVRRDSRRRVLLLVTVWLAFRPYFRWFIFLPSEVFACIII